MSRGVVVRKDDGTFDYAYAVATSAERISQNVVDLLDIGGSGGGSSRSLIAKVTSDYTMIPENRIILCDCSTSNITVTLPLLDDGIRSYMAMVKKIDDSANKVTIINPAGTIDSYPTKEILFKNTSLALVSLDNDFYIV